MGKLVCMCARARVCGECMLYVRKVSFFGGGASRMHIVLVCLLSCVCTCKCNS